ncbi:MAG: AgmX/PglI C-terminal domain-containing protein, partial [Bdellovibrionales bacterium]|nr:AgmX/PglI C-terminal domain-containing protein [Bdellovibrionales bacterium]
KDGICSPPPRSPVSPPTKPSPATAPPSVPNPVTPPPKPAPPTPPPSVPKPVMPPQEVPTPPFQAPEEPPPMDESLPYEKPSTKEAAFEDLDVPNEFVIRPLSKTQKEKRPDTQSSEETGVSALKQTEVLPPHPPSTSPPADSVESVLTKEPSPSESYPAFDSVELDKKRRKDDISIKSTGGTYAPPSGVQDLDRSIPTGSGPVIEVLVSWKERVLSVHHFFKEDNKEVTFGSDPKARIPCPNLIGKMSYKLLKMGQQPAVYLSDGVEASMIDHKGKKHAFSKLVEKGLVTTHGSSQILPLGQDQLIRLDFSSILRVYVRYANRSQKALTSGLFDFAFSEMMGLMMSVFFMSVLFFYLALFSPQFLDPDEDLEEEGVKKATIEFNKKPKKRVVKLKMASQRKKTKLSLPHKEKVPKKRKKVGIKKKGAEGRLGQVAAKPKEKSKKKTVTSARPGGSVTTGKSGAGPKSPRPDPTKIGLLGVFGKKGTQKELDKAYSGTGELAGLAEQATGYAGQKESYTGEGIGTKFKNTGAGGKGSALIGVSAGIKTKGRGGGVRGYGAGGSLGQRGTVELQLGTSDWEVEGGIDKNAILRVIRRNKHQLERCYEFALQKKPDLEGKVLVQWNIVNERVRGTKVKRNTTRDSVLARCLMDRLKNFRFTGTGLQKGQIGEVSIPFVVTKK